MDSHFLLGASQVFQQLQDRKTKLHWFKISSCLKCFPHKRKKKLFWVCQTSSFLWKMDHCWPSVGLIVFTKESRAKMLLFSFLINCICRVVKWEIQFFLQPLWSSLLPTIVALQTLNSGYCSVLCCGFCEIRNSTGSLLSVSNVSGIESCGIFFILVSP